VNNGVKGVCIVHPVEEDFKELADLFGRYKAADDELRGFVIFWQDFEGLRFVLNIRRRTRREGEGPFRTIIGMGGTVHCPPMIWTIVAIHPAE